MNHPLSVLPELELWSSRIQVFLNTSRHYFKRNRGVRRNQATHSWLKNKGDETQSNGS